MPGRYSENVVAASGQASVATDILDILKNGQGIKAQQEAMVSTESVGLRLELLDLILEDVAEAHADLSDHSQCVVLSSCLRGKLCDQLAQLPPRHFRAGERIYLMGNPARSLFLLQSGLVKTSVISPDGQELTHRVYGPGDILGELCLRNQDVPHDAVASAVAAPPHISMMGAPLHCLTWSTAMTRPGIPNSHLHKRPT